MLTADAEVTKGITRINPIRVNAEIQSSPFIPLALKRFPLNFFSRFSCKGCTIQTIREKMQTTSTDNTFTYIGSSKAALLHFCTKNFLRPPPLISLDENVILPVAVFQKAKNNANIVS